MSHYPRHLITLCTLALISATLHAQRTLFEEGTLSEDKPATSRNVFQIVRDNIVDTWNHPDTYDLYVPTYAWHNRLMYDQEHIDRYNEWALGLGIGVTRFDKDGDMHQLSFMVFKDSNYYYQTGFGYSFIKTFYSENKHFNAGYGYALLFVQRHEYNYIPVPLILPVGNLGYRNVNLQAVYIPGYRNSGNVLFAWFRVGF